MMRWAFRWLVGLAILGATSCGPDGGNCSPCDSGHFRITNEDGSTDSAPAVDAVDCSTGKCRVSSPRSGTEIVACQNLGCSGVCACILTGIDSVTCRCARAVDLVEASGCREGYSCSSGRCISDQETEIICYAN
jgi:hypothetical protein